MTENKERAARQIFRKTIIVSGRLAARKLRLDLAKTGSVGTGIMSFEHAAARLAGGFSCPIDSDALHEAIHRVLPSTNLGELEVIKDLPGMVGAASDTLHKAWRSGIDLQARAGDNPRMAAIASLEAAILKVLPAGMLRPADIVAMAIGRLTHAESVLGSIEIVGQTEMSPCWRPLLFEIAKFVPVVWNAGPREVPKWLEGKGVEIRTSSAEKPSVLAVSAATSLHEAIEAIRWARDLVASGCAKPSEIAISAASTPEYDDHLLTLRADANLDIRFVHGTGVLATRGGQAVAALADILSRGLSHTRLWRLAILCRDEGLFEGLPEGWRRVLPAEAPLSSSRAWERLLGKLGSSDWPDGIDHTDRLRETVRTLSGGFGEAEAIGQSILSRAAFRIWRKALENGPPAAIPTTIGSLRIDDSQQAPNAIAWMPASALAASPRKFVRLLGLTSRAWPRLASEDRLLPDHVIRIEELDPLPIGAADRRDFDTILKTTQSEVVLSRPRRDGEGRLLGKSPLLHGIVETEAYLQRNRIPAHAMSEADRLLARRDEYRTHALARSAEACWLDWLRQEVTAHDGLVRSDHPLIQRVLNREQSATSLRKLLRDPLGFVWRYGLGFKAPTMGAEPLTIDNRDFGELMHAVLDGTVKRLEATRGVSAASKAQVLTAVESSLADVAEEFEADRSVPPDIIWQRTLAEVRDLSVEVVKPDDEASLDGQRSYAEVPFARADIEDSTGLPWDARTPVTIPDAGLRISGAIDRLDLSGDGLIARVNDYKTGRAPKDLDFVLSGGKELQRCLYSFAVRALLGSKVTVQAALRYPRSGKVAVMEDAATALSDLTRYLVFGRENLVSGRALPGIDTTDEYNDLAFALPANAGNTYWPRKEEAASEALGAATKIWDAI